MQKILHLMLCKMQSKIQYLSCVHVVFGGYQHSVWNSLYSTTANSCVFCSRTVTLLEYGVYTTTVQLIWVFIGCDVNLTLVYTVWPGWTQVQQYPYSRHDMTYLHTRNYDYTILHRPLQVHPMLLCSSSMGFLLQTTGNCFTGFRLHPKQKGIVASLVCSPLC